MKQLLVLILVLMAGNECHAASTNADFYLSPTGSDVWSGTLANPNKQGTDGPFATLDRVRNAVRELKKKKTSDIVVLIRGGTYQLKKTVVFGLQDSGVGDSTVTYAAYPGETPVFTSGREITGWKKVSGKIPGLPEKAEGNIWVANVSGRFFTLYDSQGMLPRAKSAGFIPLPGGSRNRLQFPKGNLKNWSNVAAVEIVVRPHHAWIVNILPLASIDEKKQIARTSINATYAMNRLHFLKTTKSCWVENVLDELDEPGEWVLNAREGKVYLWPRGKSPIIAPQLIELIRVEGIIDKKGPKDIPVRNLCFRGLTFSHGDRYTLSKDDAGLQHDWDMLDKANALLRFRGAENCVVEKCHFAHSGSGAIRVDQHGQKITISGNHIEHMGGAGILLCGCGPGTKDVNKNNLVYNNHIHHIGQIYAHSPGIMVWQSGENRVANNLIHHTPYTGIIISGCMTHFFTKNVRELGRTIRRHEIKKLPKKPNLEDVRPYLHTHDNLIEYNEIHHAMEMLGDGNGIYIRGAGAGNVIRRNYIHHLVTPMIMQSAIRTDGGQKDTVIAENLIYKCVSQGIIAKLNTRVENNIIADIIAPPRGYYLKLREGPLTGATIKRNIFYSSSKVCVFIDEPLPGKAGKATDRRGRKLAKAKDADTDYNIYFCAANPKLSKTFLQKQQVDGIDAHSLAVDPLFVNPKNGDFRLQPNSPASKLGFVPFNMSKVGLRKWNKRQKKPLAYLETGGKRRLNIVYKQISNRKLLLDLYYPTANGKKRNSPCPIIIYTHGGGWAAGSKQGVARGLFKVVFEKLLNHGFAVASVNYRLCRKNSSVTIRDCVTDAMDAVRYLAKNSGTLKVDRTQFFTMGDSAGGQLAQMLLLSSPESFPGDKKLAGVRYRMVAGVSWYGPCDFEKMELFNHDGRKDFRDRFAPRILGTNSKPKDKLARYREISPVYYLTMDSPPLLMIQGDKDTTIPVKHAHYMKQRAKAVKAPVEIMIIKNAGHNWRKVGADIEPSREAIVARTVQFFIDHCKSATKSKRS